MSTQPITIAQSQLQSQARLTLNSRAQISDPSGKIWKSHDPVKGTANQGANAQTFSEVLRSTSASGAQWQPIASATGQNSLSSGNVSAG
jgi:hypothetical protein